jgi:hypothetical protein
VHTPEPLGRGAGWLGRAGRACGEAGWAEPRIRPKSRIQIRKHFSFSKLFYKLQINFEFQRLLLAQQNTRALHHTKKKYATV